MSVKCPHCANEMSLKGARPGRFTPACPLCKQKFVLTIPESGHGEPHVAKLRPEAISADIADVLGIDVPKPKAATPQRTSSAAKPGASTGAARPAPVARTSVGTSAASVATVPPAPSQVRVPSSSSIAATAAPAPSQMGPGGVATSNEKQIYEVASDHKDLPAAEDSQHGDSVLADDSQVAQGLHDVKHTHAKESHAGDSHAARVAPPVAHAPQKQAAAGHAPSAHATSVPAAPAPAHPHHEERQASAPADPDLVGSLGGYELIRKLGAGGMGAVYLARQVSLDRDVAVKVLQSALSEDAQFVARFTREAYAAAQLNHHNVVQIHDIGEQKSTHFFSMEFVEGQTLADLVKQNGPIDPEIAAGYILQAARGLRFAHDHGMVHRDIKPENLMLNDQGLVKVADLGLVKTVGSNEPKGATPAGSAADSKIAQAASASVTQARWAMGTPAYMAPEQTQDAAAVDSRADIYSLGCTFYDLLTGRPPFSGRTAIEVMTKHMNEMPQSPERIAKHVPVTLSAIVMKMMAKKPEQRFQSMAEVVKSLEDFLHVDSSKPFSPKQEHVRVVEFAVERFNASKWAKLRPWIIRGFYAVCVVGAIACGMLIDDPVNKIRWGGAFVGLGVLTTIAYIVLTGITQKTLVFKKLRQLVFGAGVFDWLAAIIGVVLIGAALYAFNQHWGWIIVSGLAIMLANAFHFSIDLLMAKDRAAPLMQTDSMLKEMRLKGLEENALRQFVCKYSSENWEEFYEALFGYEAKMLAREKWGQSERGKDRKKYASWRDGLIAWVDHKMKSRKEAKERRLLERLERKSLVKSGLDEKQALKQARRKADTMLAKAEKLQRSSRQSMMSVGPTIAKSNVKFEVVRAGYMHDDDEAEESETAKSVRKRESYFQRRFGGVSGLIMGQQTRFLLAAIVLFGFCSWQYQNREQYNDEFRKMSGTNMDPEAIATAKNITTAKQLVDDVNLKGSDKELKATRLSDDAAKVKGPKQVRDVAQQTAGFYDRQRDNITKVFGRWGAGLAGVLLLVGAFFRGKLLGIMVILSAVVVLSAPFLQPAYMGIDTFKLTAIAGSVMFAVCLFFLRETVAPG